MASPCCQLPWRSIQPEPENPESSPEHACLHLNCRSPTLTFLEAPRGSTVDFPQVLFSARAVPRWQITLSDSGSQLDILRLEFQAHYAEVEAATQVASSLPVQSFVRTGPALPLFGHSRVRSLAVLDFVEPGSSSAVRSTTCPGSRPPAFGASCLGFTSIVLDPLRSEASLFARSLSRSECLMLASNLADFGPSLPLQGLA